MTHIIYTPDTDLFRLTDREIFGESPLPAEFQKALVEAGFGHEEVFRTVITGRPVVSSQRIEQMRGNYQKLRGFLRRLPAKVGIITYSNGFKALAKAKYQGEEPYGVPENIKPYFLPTDGLFTPSFYAVNLEEKTVKPKDVTDALRWLGIDTSSEYDHPPGIDEMLMQLKDDTFGETEKLWNFEEFMDAITPKNRTIITDIYIHDALPETKRFKYVISGFRL